MVCPHACFILPRHRISTPPRHHAYEWFACPYAQSILLSLYALWYIFDFYYLAAPEVMRYAGA